MISVRSLKLGGGLSRSQMRDMLRACRNCPLQGLLLNCKVWPGGYASEWSDISSRRAEYTSAGWTSILRGAHPHFFNDTVHHSDEDVLSGINDQLINSSDTSADHDHTQQDHPKEAILNVIARHYADTIEHISLLGYIGCPMLKFHEHAVDELFITPLKHPHQLRTFETAVCWNQHALEQFEMRSSIQWAGLLAYLENDPYGPENGPWKSCGPVRDGGLQIAHRYAVDVFDKFARHLSPQAKRRTGGVCLRAVIVTGDVDLVFEVYIGVDGEGKDKLLRHTPFRRWRDKDGVFEMLKRARDMQSMQVFSRGGW
ncbi:hypothetical protein BDZ85DRAFT_84481 [Elsinoe ampelina]|uniref:Uncharacterized protein n=1 Tax=Elsinoe ampelina TaxID=302913 RepID=A0A6A6GGP8_9PEZI|nr:hypothetical protein BDZ85DRAFT_84481 [Elsinoe ampelina]